MSNPISSSLPSTVNNNAPVAAVPQRNWLDKLSDAVQFINDKVLNPLIQVASRVLKMVDTLTSAITGTDKSNPQATAARRQADELNATMSDMSLPGETRDLPADSMTFLLASGLTIQAGGRSFSVSEFLQALGKPDGKNLTKAEMTVLRNALDQVSKQAGDIGSKIHQGFEIALTVLDKLRGVLGLVPSMIPQH